MAVDAGKLKRRHNLGAPPTEGTPGIEEGSALAPQAEKLLPESPIPASQRLPENRDRHTLEAAAPESVPAGSAEPAARTAQVAPTDPSGAGEANSAREPGPPDPEPDAEPAPARRAALPVAGGRGEGPAASAQRQRAPRPTAEPRVPFTTRVTLSTKERLEDACYHLRRKHQDFINEAILAYLKKHGF